MGKAAPLGLTLGFFKHLITLHGGRDAFAGLSTAAVCEQFVKSYTAATRLSLVEHVHRNHPRGREYAKPATWFVSHAWSYLYLDVVDALSDFMDEQGLDTDGVAVWFCMFNNNQHDVLNKVVPFEFWVDSFETALQAIGNVVMVLSPWNNPTTLTRTWCVFEIYVAIKANARFEVAMGKTQKADFLTDIQDDRSFFKMLGTIKSAKSTTFVPSDRDNIVALMAKMKIGFSDLDRMLFDVLEAWMFRTVEAQLGTENKAHWLGVLANIWIDKKVMAKAREYLNQAIELYRVDGDTGAAMWTAMGLAAAVDGVLGQPRSVWEPKFQDAITHLTTVSGPASLDTLTTMLEFALAYLRVRDIDAAVPLLRDCFDVCDRVHGPAHDLTLRVMNAMGMAYTYKHELATAQVWLENGLAQTKRTLGDDHPRVVTCMNNLGVNLSKQGKVALASDLYDAAYTSRRRTLGPDHQLTWLSYRHWGQSLLRQGKFAQAKDILVACRDAATRLGHTEDSKHECDVHIGRLYLSMGDFDHAMAHLERAHKGNMALFGPMHPDTRYALVWRWLAAQTTVHTLADAAMWQRELERAGTFHETWVGFSCVSCYRPIQGLYITCVECPKYSSHFCHACVKTHVSYCTHGDAALETLKPPARVILEKQLTILAPDTTDYHDRFDAYETYCATYHVPQDEQLVRRIADNGWWSRVLACLRRRDRANDDDDRGLKSI
ncbi:Aste57867_9751 [Aphanomyces stellatus]|uniref:Aste57867_9751 protein n=1 Tax=Aphanomyces stellatus TaxID=120398 RepID=A0A485KP39_9STRA|nr:hypothetical protein As57867_009712 [Aphanomyces stellatus]VFT86630.1 Aste57867_9751 [Aphanomyces stellatus]